VLSGRRLCDELITRPEKSYRLWCVVVCDLETSKWGGHDPRLVAAPQKKKSSSIYININRLPSLLVESLFCSEELKAIGCRTGRH
jgi:hypothetical protein